MVTLLCFLTRLLLILGTVESYANGHQRNFVPPRVGRGAMGNYGGFGPGGFSQNPTVVNQGGMFGGMGGGFGAGGGAGAEYKKNEELLKKIQEGGDQNRKSISEGGTKALQEMSQSTAKALSEIAKLGQVQDAKVDPGAGPQTFAPIQTSAVVDTIIQSSQESAKVQSSLMKGLINSALPPEGQKPVPMQPIFVETNQDRMRSSANARADRNPSLSTDSFADAGNEPGVTKQALSPIQNAETGFPTARGAMGGAYNPPRAPASQPK